MTGELTVAESRDVDDRAAIIGRVDGDESRGAVRIGQKSFVYLLSLMHFMIGAGIVEGVSRLKLGGSVVWLMRWCDRLQRLPRA